MVLRNKTESNVKLGLGIRVKSRRRELALSVVILDGSRHSAVVIGKERKMRTRTQTEGATDTLNQFWMTSELIPSDNHAIMFQRRQINAKTSYVNVLFEF